MVSDPPHFGHFLGLHLPSLVAPQLLHLKIAIIRILLSCP
jgi:hypothetical protein